MKDGLYIVDHGEIHAAFAVRGGEVVSCAPILRKKFDFFAKIANWYPTNLETRPLKDPENEPVESS